MSKTSAPPPPPPSSAPGVRPGHVEPWLRPNPRPNSPGPRARRERARRAALVGDGPARCEFCLGSYAEELELICASCDQPVCPFCVLRLQRPCCPGCADAGEGARAEGGGR